MYFTVLVRLHSFHNSNYLNNLHNHVVKRPRSKNILLAEILSWSFSSFFRNKIYIYIYQIPGSFIRAWYIQISQSSSAAAQVIFQCLPIARCRQKYLAGQQPAMDARYAWFNPTQSRFVHRFRSDATRSVTSTTNCAQTNRCIDAQ